MILMTLTGSILLMFGLLLLIVPGRLQQWNANANRQLFELDRLIMTHRLTAGLCLISGGIFCLASTYLLWLLLHRG